MKQTTFSDLERNNKTCMYAHLIDSSIMTLFCILQALSGLQTWGYIIIFAVLGFGPVIAEFFFWNKSSILLPSVSLFFTVLQSSLQPTVSYFYLLSR